ncbi:MAG: hypothetical protein M3O50_01865 [Myxococcota bacterium]|nr:hypothetical protein [Myxococcota bacterium]
MNSGGAGKAWVVVLAVLIAPGCSTYAVSRYAVSAPNVAALRMLRGHPINVGAFSAAEEVSKIDCRAVGPIKTPDAESFTEYVRAALISELEMAEVYSVTAPVTLTGTLDQIDFSSVSGQWNLGLTVVSSNGKRLRVDETYGFTSSYFGETACNQTAQAFMPGVQDLIAKLVKDPAFRSLVASPQGTLPPAS